MTYVQSSMTSFLFVCSFDCVRCTVCTKYFRPISLLSEDLRNLVCVERSTWLFHLLRFIWAKVTCFSGWDRVCVKSRIYFNFYLYLSLYAIHTWYACLCSLIHVCNARCSWSPWLYILCKKVEGYVLGFSFLSSLCILSPLSLEFFFFLSFSLSLDLTFSLSLI